MELEGSFSRLAPRKLSAGVRKPPASVRSSNASRALRSNSFALGDFASVRRLTPNTSFHAEEREPLQPRNREVPPKGTTLYKLATDMLKQHSQLGAHVDFKPMSSAAKIRHTRVIESRGRKALYDIRRREERGSKLPYINDSMENESVFPGPVPITSLISLKRKQMNSAPRQKSDLERTEELLKILRIPTEMRKRSHSRRAVEVVKMKEIPTQTDSVRSSPEKIGGTEDSFL